MVKRYRNKKKDNLRLWNIYHGIKKRCYNHNCKRYDSYGGRGITMCDEWVDDFDSFADWAKSNGYQDDLSIDRIDNDGNYTPNNCKWSTNVEQCRNKRDTLIVEYMGVEKPLKSWCEELGLKYDTMHDRIYKRKWTVNKAFNTKSQRENSFASKCRTAGINVGTAYDRIHKLGWEPEIAINTESLGLGSNQTTYGAK